MVNDFRNNVILGAYDINESQASDITWTYDLNCKSPAPPPAVGGVTTFGEAVASGVMANG